MARKEYDLIIPAAEFPGQPPIPAHRLHYYQWGDDNAKRTVLCMHGLTRNGLDFEVLAEALVAKGYRVIAPDMPGRGKSDYLSNSEAYGFPTYAYDVTKLLDHLQVEKVDWIGTSMGGIVAMALPNRISSLVLNDVGCELPKTGLKQIAEKFATKPKSQSHDDVVTWLREHAWKPFDIPAQYWEQTVNNHLVEENGNWRLAFDPRILIPLVPGTAQGKPDPDAIQPVDLRPGCYALAAAKIPTLIVRGEQSDLLPFPIAVETQQILASAGAPAEVQTVPDVGHAPMLMYERDTKRVGEWLDKQVKQESARSGAVAR